MRTVLAIALLATCSANAESSSVAINPTGYSVSVIDSATQTQVLWMDCYGAVKINPRNSSDTIVNVYWCRGRMNTAYNPPTDLDNLPMADNVLVNSLKGEQYEGHECFIIRSFSQAYPGGPQAHTLVEVIC